MCAKIMRSIKRRQRIEAQHWQHMQEKMSVEELEDMVKTVNASAVALQDRLSDHVYKYDFARHEIYRADQEQQRQAELNAEQARTHATGR